MSHVAHVKVPTSFLRVSESDMILTRQSTPILGFAANLSLRFFEILQVVLTSLGISLTLVVYSFQLWQLAARRCDWVVFATKKILFDSHPELWGR